MEAKDADLVTTDSNTTNVKVKLSQCPARHLLPVHSNTTNVKVKLLDFDMSLFGFMEFKYNQC